MISPHPVDRFIGDVEWRFAKTMPQWPHWYVMKAWNPGREVEFAELVRRIFEEGRDEQWGVGKWERTVRYYFAGDFKYWVMDPTMEATNLINRARIDGAGPALVASSDRKEYDPMTKSIRLTVTSPDHAAGSIAGFRYFWAYYVDGFRSDRHCQPCFRGAAIPEFSTATGRTGTPTELDRIGNHKFLYVCGVGVGPRHELYRKNFHLPLRYAEGESVSAVTYNGYLVTAKNAVLLQVPALPKDWRPLADGETLPDAFTRCRNFQFGVEYFGYPSPASP